MMTNGLELFAGAETVSRWLTKLKDHFLRRIHDHGDLLRRTTSRRKDFFAGFVNRQDRIGKAETPFFECLENP